MWNIVCVSPQEHRSVSARRNEYWRWSWPLLGKKGRVLQTAGILAYSWLKALVVNGDSHSANVGRMLA